LDLRTHLTQNEQNEEERQGCFMKKEKNMIDRIAFGGRMMYWVM
jgi:hypothetical protein